MSSGVTKWGGLAAMLGGILGIVLTPKLTYLYTTLDWDDYTAYDKLYFLSLPPELVGFYALRKLRGRGGSEALERWGFRLSLVGMWLAVLGVLTDYWVDVPPGFWAVIVGTPFLVAGFVLLGAGLWRVGAIPLLITLVMVGAGVEALKVMFWVDHVPSGPLLTFHVAWIVLGGYVLWSGRNALPEQPSRVS